MGEEDVAMVARIDSVLTAGEFWGHPGEYKPSADEMLELWKVAGIDYPLTREEAQNSLDERGGGIKITYRVAGGTRSEVKHWCGIFATAMARYGGFNVRWNLRSGKPEGAITYIAGRKGIQPGDIAIIPREQHHRLIWSTSSDGNEKLYWSIDGNTHMQKIRWMENKWNDTWAETIYGYYRLQAA